MVSVDTLRNVTINNMMYIIIYLLYRLKLFRGLDNVEPYQGARDLESLVQFVMDEVAGDMEKTTDNEGENDEVKRDATNDAMEDDDDEQAMEVERDEHGVLHLTDQTFNKVINSKEGILFVKFYAPW